MKKRISVLALTAIIALGGIGLSGVETAAADGAVTSDSSVITSFKAKVVDPVMRLLGSTWS